MFTGIVRQVGTVASIELVEFGASLHVDPQGWSHVPQRGDSISVNGCCLTCGSGAKEAAGRLLPFDVIRQTLETTTLGELKVGDEVNLEHAVTPTTLLGGHVVQGHIDGVAKVTAVVRNETEWRLHVEPPFPLMDFIVEKGSVALDGVSLTVAAVDERAFDVALIPTTLELTTLGRVEPGSRLNVETDSIAKTVVHWLRRREAVSPDV